MKTQSIRITIVALLVTFSIVTACESESNPTPETESDELIDEETPDNEEEGNGEEGNEEEGNEEEENDDEDNNEDEEDESDTDNPTASVVETHGRLQVSGNKILDKNNDVIQLRGMSLFWSQWMGQYYTEEAISWLKNDWNCNIVRAAMGVEDSDGYLSNKETEKQKVFTVIDAAIKEGIYVIVDWHSHHAEDYVNEAKSFFAEVAQKYGDSPNLIYEIYNEPLNVSWTEVLKPYHEEVIASIREFDSDNLIICGTRTWSQDVDEVIGNTINDNNVAYTLHYYAATHKQSLRDKAQNAINNNIPIFVTEYGVSEASGDGSIDENEARTWWDFLDQNKISWCNWSIADKDELSAALKPGASGLGGWTEDQLTTSGAMVRNEIISKNP
ncbi:glycoside hydrolase family 5 protein [Aquimarina pacifica]|uniref:glycoside hydrolase family 5 protein n=1 Tax=Aquimarina pacifica TaxID=1296415 RepID=UPI000471E92A|nr:glycoside hydrolase family 5 protein [Aquimarina pacifica]